MAQFRIWSQRTDFARRESLCIFVNDDNGRQSVAAPLVFTDCTDILIEKPTIDASRHDLTAKALMQAFLDHAWDIGLRPAGYAGMTEHVGALKSHLDDMRALVFVNKIPALVPPGLVSDLTWPKRGDD